MDDKPKKNFGILIILGVLIVLVLVGLFVFRNNGQGEKLSPQVTTIQPEQSVVESTPGDEMTKTTEGSVVKEFTVVGGNYSFDPSTITVNKGDIVRITFKDGDGLHNLAIEGYNVMTDTLSTGGSSTVEFVADKVGAFEYFCSVDSHRERGMTGSLIVK